jgi:hypothetical protein
MKNLSDWWGLESLRYNRRQLKDYLFLAFFVLSSCQGIHQRFPSSIIGTDSRVIPDEVFYPLSAIGLIEVSDKNNKVITRCTGTVVHENTVLTNAHCLLDREKKNILNDGFARFYPGILQFEKKFGSYELNLSKKRNFYVPSSFKLDQGNDDFAFLRFPLSNDVGVIKVIPFEDQWLGKNNWNFSSQVKSRGLYHIVLNDQPCTIHRRVSAQLLGHDCDAIPGSSGSPIFSNFNGDVFLVALHFGQAGSERKCDEVKEGVCENYALASQLFFEELKRFVKEK